MESLKFTAQLDKKKLCNAARSLVVSARTHSKATRGEIGEAEVSRKYLQSSEKKPPHLLETSRGHGHEYLWADVTFMILDKNDAADKPRFADTSETQRDTMKAANNRHSGVHTPEKTMPQVLAANRVRHESVE